MVQAILMCAGKSTRTHPLTLTRPKPLLKVAGKTIIEHNLNQLDGLVDEVIIIVGYKKEMIMNYLGDSYKKMKLKYAEQKEQLGTAHAVQQAERYVKDKVIVMNGDDFFSRVDIKNCLAHDNCILAMEVEDPRNYGIVLLEGGSVKEIIEKPKNPTSNLANVGLYVFDKCVFDELKKVKVSRRGEYELTDVIGKLGITCAVSCEKVKGYWIPICYAWNLLCANEFFMKDIKEKNEGEVEPNATIKGEVVIGKGTIVKNGTYIEGPVIIGKDCVLGPNCYIRSNTVMGDNCKIGNAVEIKNSILSDSVSIGHLSYIGDSVVGEKVNIAAGNLTANLRHDGKEICTIFCDKKIGTNRRKFGTVIGDHVHTGINTSIYPGRKIWPHLSTMPGEIVKDDKTD